jgi:hypothetical protein
MYQLTEFDMYLGVNGSGGRTSPWFRETMVLASTGDDAGAPSDAGAPTEAGPATMSFAWTDISENSSQQSPLARNGTISFDSSAASIDFACPGNSAPFSASFTAVPGSLILFVDSPGVGTGKMLYKQH